MRTPARIVSAALVVVGLCIAAASQAPSQSPAKDKSGGMNMPNAFQGFSRDRDEPVKIESDSLEIHDRERFAIFNGNVVVQQGDSTMRSRQLKVYYEGELSKAGKRSAPAQTEKDGATRKKDPAQRIRRLEAIGGVIISSKDQRATGDLGVFDMRSNTATISGNVVISQGPNVMQADRLIVDLDTGWSRLESASKDGRGRVQGVFVPGSVGEPKASKKGTAN